MKIANLYAFFLSASVIFSVPADLSAQVNQSELNKGQQGQIEFQNYTGQTPAGQINTRSQIRDIGYPLGTAIKGGSQRSGQNNRYYVIHAQTNTPEGDKLDADILGLGAGVGVDHIRNLRLIIQGYLEGAYNYSAADAALLSEYITIYNAVFRGNRGYFNTVYKSAVMQYLTPPANIGLSTRYTEWPGRTLIVIPLGNSTAGSLSAIDTSSLTGSSVIDEMRRTDEDEGAERRTAMADLKDREAEEAEEAARRIREAIAAEEAKIAAERAALEAERDRLNRAEAERRERELAEREAALAREREAAQQAEDFANRKREEAEQDRRDIAGETGLGAGAGLDGSDGQTGQDGTDGSGSDSAGSDSSGGDGAGSDGTAGETDFSNWDAGLYGGSTDGSGGDGSDGSDGTGGDGAGSDGSGSGGAGQDGQESLAGSDSAKTGQDGQGDNAGQDAASAGSGSQNSADAQNPAAGSGGGDEEGGFVVRQDGTSAGVVAMVIPGKNSSQGYIVRVDSATGKELQRSAYSDINVRSVIFLNDKTIIALQGTGTAVKLVAINMDTLGITGASQSLVDANSMLWVKGTAVYAILSSGGKQYIGRFGADVTLQAQSDVPIHPYAGVNFQGEMLIITQGDDGKALLLDPVTLKKK
ncbi:MAG: hypothetical protein LBG87_04140 [Spirochaetaceae bacterium]|jgi:hypothetical protein|nr:hypothetical protein [Spirochaetaceae bacterium]